MIVPDLNLLIYAHNEGAPFTTARETGGRTWLTARSVSAYRGW